jgi:anti-anti-sigma factor
MRPRGELDCSTTPTFDARAGEAAEALRAGFARVVLDLSALTFIDSTGLRAILRMAMALSQPSGLVIVRGRRSVQRVFELTGTERMLPFVSLEQALAHPRT